MRDIETGPGWELRLGSYQDVLADVTCDALITDPPYSERVHAAYEDAGDGSLQIGDMYQGRPSKRTAALGRRALTYASWSSEDVAALVESWSPRCTGWLACLTSHDLEPAYAAAYDASGRCGFAPVALVQPGSTVRLAGDGPSSWVCYLAVSRPRSAKWLAERKRLRDERGDAKALPGAYVCAPERGRILVGGKPLDAMRAIVRDYSEPGDLVCDPCAGGGTTLLAAVIEGRRAIGAERDPETFRAAVERLRRGYTPTLL
jgi:hypothetical protein